MFQQRGHLIGAQGILRLITVGLLLLGGGTMARAQKNVTFTSNTTIGASNTTYDGDNVTVSGCTVTIDGTHPFNSLHVTKSGIVTHDAGLAGGMNLTVGNVTIDAGSYITAAGQGNPGGQGAGAGGNDNSGNYGGGGGSYGGVGHATSGAAGGVVYGSIKKPIDLGSGGGTGFGGANPGSAGGGAIQLTVGGTLTVNGFLSADGSAGSRGGGGSGGSLYLTAGTLTGSGAITARGGGYTGNNGGAGGGGRIALYYGANSFVGLMGAYGGNCDYGWAGAGTLFLQQTAQTQGDLFVDNSGHGSYSVILPGGMTFDDIDVRNSSNLIPSTGTLSVTVLSNFTVEAGSTVSVSGLGYGPGTGPGAGNADSTGNYGGGGGSYGGYGHNTSGALAGTPYGSVKQPTDPGSGGGAGFGGSYVGSAGGGAIAVTVGGTLRVDGDIRADGVTNYRGGAGSGGSILFNVGTFTGGGYISASGGYAGSNGGGGGGGRIAVYYGTNTFSGGLHAYGTNCDYGYAGAGTIFEQQTLQSQGNLLIDNGGHNNGVTTFIPDGLTFDNIDLRGGAGLSPVSGDTLTVTTNQNFTIESSSFITGLVNLTIIGNLDIQAGASISASGLGYGPGQGPGAGAADASGNYGGGGGGYGGAGRTTSGAAGGTTYGSLQLPTAPGSGGGAGFGGAYAGGPGGGTIQITVNNTFQLDGNIHADGITNYRGGAGSGGSILLNVGTFAGSGLVSASGGYAGSNGGGGGGGRIAVYSGKSTFAGGLVANGGNCDYGPASNGTVYTETTTGVTLQSIVFNPATVAEGLSATATLTLSAPAPTGGVTINLNNSNPNAATVPANVTVAAGATTATFGVTTNTTALPTATTVSAELGGQLASATLDIVPYLANLTLNPAAVPAGTATTGTLALNLPAPSGGLNVNLASNNAAASVPTSVKVAAGATSATFPVTTSSTLTSETDVAITASNGVESTSGTLHIDPSSVAIKAFALSPSAVVGGNVSIGVVSLTGRAPAGGAVIAIGNSNGSIASAPAILTIPAGKSSGQFVILTDQVSATTPTTLSATLGTVTKTAVLQVAPNGVSSLVLVPTSVKGGQETAVGVVTLQYPAAVATTVTITSNSASAIPDASIVIPPGQTTGTFNIDTAAVTATTTATITATANKVAKTAKLTVN
jgi:hypothetical protein